MVRRQMTTVGEIIMRWLLCLTAISLVGCTPVSKFENACVMQASSLIRQTQGVQPSSSSVRLSTASLAAQGAFVNFVLGLGNGLAASMIMQQYTSLSDIQNQAVMKAATGGGSNGYGTVLKIIQDDLSEILEADIGFSAAGRSLSAPFYCFVSKYGKVAAIVRPR
jgi:hypothetical protein